MPKTEIDYSNTIIYKITCKNLLVNELYVGHTTNFIQRKHTHKSSCINEKSKNYKCKLYDVIRKNGGWNNWKMEIVDIYNCRDHNEAIKKELEMTQTLNATLNSIELKPKIVNITEEYVEIKEIKKLKKNLPRFFCETCAFKCYMKCDWTRHITRPKHFLSVDGNIKNLKNLKKTYVCDCGKIFLSNSGLWKHKKVCIEEKNIIIDKELNDKELIMILIKQNSELLEVIKNGKHNTINSHNNTNSNNKTFNLQFFLNETCKDAMNIMDFVDLIKLQLTDLESVGKIGYVDGISNIIVTNLNALDEKKRPVHCTDTKREVLYIKDNNKWEKEDEENKKMHKLITKVADKNARLLPKFKEAHPDCIKSVSPFSDQYNKLIIEAMGGSGDNDLEKEKKIIRKISKTVTIDKLNF